MAEPAPESEPEPAASMRRYRLALLALVGLVVAWLADRALYPWLLDLGARVEESANTFLRLGRSLGSLPLWLLLALVLARSPRSAATPGGERPGGRPALRLLGSVALAGGLAVLLKTLVRRERPRAHGGEFFFRSWFDDLGSRSGFGMPSGEASLAFAGAFVLCRLWPAAGPVGLALAMLCALQRVFVGAHFVSDVYVALLVGGLAAAGVGRLLGDGRARAERARSGGPALIAVLVATVLGLPLLSRTLPWRAASAEELVGVYRSLESHPRAVHLALDAQGHYRRAELRGGAQAELALGEGRWSLVEDGLALDGGEAWPVRLRDDLLRLEDARGPVFLRRLGRPSGAP